MILYYSLREGDDYNMHSLTELNRAVTSWLLKQTAIIYVSFYGVILDPYWENHSAWWVMELQSEAGKSELCSTLTVNALYKT
jgi:hypothetical protein